MSGRLIAGDKYLIESVIGSGAMGIVFKGTHRELGRTVAIKVLNPRPFSADAPYRVLIKHANETPRSPSELAPGLAPGIEAVILRALEKDPERRFQSARDMGAELRKAL